MLYGYLLFQSKYFKEIRDMTLNCQINLNVNHWSNVSSETNDLIMKILTFEDKRITTDCVEPSLVKKCGEVERIPRKE